MKKSLLLGFLIGQTVYSAPRIEIEPPVLPDENFSSIAVQDELITRKLEVTDRAIICKDVYLCDVTIGDNLLIEGDLSVEGNSNLNNLTLSGDATLTNLTVTGNTELNDLTVTGNTNLNDVTLSGDATLTNLTVTGNTNLNELTVSGNSQLTDLTVTGDTLLSNGSVTGNFTIDGTLFVSTPLSFPSLSITNDADIGCNLTVGCNIYTQNTNSTIGAYYKAGLPWLHNFGPNNTFLGTQAGNFTITGGNNAGFGDSTLISLSSGNFNTGCGRSALFNLASGSSNTAVGYSAGITLTTGSGNIYINADAGAPAESNTTRIGTGQTRNFQAGIRGAIPANTDTALVSIDSANQLGTGIVYNDINLANTTTTQGAILKNGVLFLHNSGPDNLFVGPSAGNRTTTGLGNIGIGLRALLSITSGINNIGIGTDAAGSVQTGFGNVAVGISNLSSLSASSSNNTAIGNQALDNVTAGIQNTALGSSAFPNLQVGNGNIGIGSNVGASLQIGSNNIYIGNAGFLVENGVIRIGTVGTHTQTTIQGEIFFQTLGATTASVLLPLHRDPGTGQIFQFTSSRKFKKNIEPISDQIAQKFMQLQPVSYNALEDTSENPRKIYGFIAEDVNDTMPELVINDSDGKPLTIGYVVMHALLLKLIQNQENKINALQEMHSPDKVGKSDAKTIKLIKAELAEHSSKLNNQESMIAQLQEKLAEQDNLIQSFSSDIVMLKAIIESISRTTRIS